MPLYEYRCNDCQKTFELLRGSAERSLAALCPACESRSSMPLVSRIAATTGGNYDADLPAPDSNPSAGGGGCCGGSCGCG